MRNLYVVLIGMFTFVGLSLADSGTAPDLTATLLSLWQAIQTHAGTALILVPIFQILRTHEVLGILGKIGLQGKGLSIAIAVITTLGFIADALATGKSIGVAAVAGLFTSGGAMLIYNAIRGIAPPSA